MAEIQISLMYGNSNISTSEGLAETRHVSGGSDELKRNKALRLEEAIELLDVATRRLRAALNAELESLKEDSDG